MHIYKSRILNGILHKCLAVLLTAALVSTSGSALAASSDEVPEAIYTGTANASAVLDNIDYTDVKSSNTWAKRAIYETGALEIIKSYGYKQYGLKNSINREEALAIVYRAAGREAEARQAGEALNNARAAAAKKTDAMNVLADGCLQLAVSDGLISQQDFTDALQQDQTTLAGTAFHRKAAAKRQEFAFWLAKVLGMQPASGEQKVYNSYKDWRSIDADKIAYIEAVLQQNIMSGDTNGAFNPNQPVTKERAAQIIKNAEDVILPVLNYQKQAGTVESIEASKDFSAGIPLLEKNFNVRNSNGKLHKIGIVSLDSSVPGYNALQDRNEQNGKLLSSSINDFIVYKNSGLGNSGLLKAGDRITYITAPDGTVRFADVISSTYDTSYIAAQVNDVNTGTQQISVTKLFKLDYPDVTGLPDSISLNPGGGSPNQTFRYSSNAAAALGNGISSMQELEVGSTVILTLKNDIVVEVKAFELKKGAEGGIVKGIVEDNNPQLGYITLYGEDGSGSSAEAQGRLSILRTYNYGNQNDIDIFKNYQEAAIEDIEPGDTVFIKLDDGNYVVSMSAADNYTVKYGRIISKKPSVLAVQYDDGVQQILNNEAGTLVISEGRLAKYGDIKDGDRVRLLLHITNKFTRLKEITLEGDEHFISNIYKGKVAYIDTTSDSLITQNLEVLTDGQWKRTERKGTTGIRLSEEYSFYAADKKLSASSINKYLKDSEAYIAVQEDYGGEERAVIVSFRDDNDSEVAYSDSVANSNTGMGEFTLSQANRKVNSNPGTIVVKDGRLVSGGSIAVSDRADVIANRSYDNGELYAGVVQIRPGYLGSLLQIYRARIDDINDNSDFTVESFSRLNGVEWDYTNTPKTFRLKADTKIIDSTGVVNQRDFISYGDGSFENRTVYILARDMDAVLISTAPYGIYNVKGEIYDITGGAIGEEGTLIQDPTGFKLRDAKVYDPSRYMWVNSNVMTLDILTESIIMKGDKFIKAGELKKGDNVRVIKADSTVTGDAYIVIVEEN